MSYANMTVDFSGVAPSKRMLFYAKKLRETGKDILGWSRIMISGNHFCYCCSPACAKVTESMVKGQLFESGDDSSVYIIGCRGDQRKYYPEIVCYQGCNRPCIRS